MILLQELNCFLFCFFVNERKNKLVAFTRSYVHQRYMQQYLRTETFPSFSVIKVIVNRDTCSFTWAYSRFNDGSWRSR